MCLRIVSFFQVLVTYTCCIRCFWRRRTSLVFTLLFICIIHRRLLTWSDSIQCKHGKKKRANKQTNRCSKVVQRWSSLQTVDRTLLESSLQYPSISFSAKLRNVLTFWCHGNTSPFNRCKPTTHSSHWALADTCFHIFAFTTNCYEDSQSWQTAWELEMGLKRNAVAAYTQNGGPGLCGFAPRKFSKFIVEICTC